MKFKIGDKVKIIKDLGGENDWTVGKTGEINGISPFSDGYPIDVKLDQPCNGRFSLSCAEEELKLCHEETHKKSMAKLSALAKRLLDSDTKALIKAGFLTSDLEFTDDGAEAVHAVVLEKYKAELVKVAKESSKKKKCKDEDEEEDEEDC